MPSHTWFFPSLSGILPFSGNISLPKQGYLRPKHGTRLPSRGFMAFLTDIYLPIAGFCLPDHGYLPPAEGNFYPIEGNLIPVYGLISSNPGAQVTRTYNCPEARYAFCT